MTLNCLLYPSDTDLLSYNIYIYIYTHPSLSYPSPSPVPCTTLSTKPVSLVGSPNLGCLVFFLLVIHANQLKAYCALNLIMGKKACRPLGIIFVLTFTENNQLFFSLSSSSLLMVSFTNCT